MLTKASACAAALVVLMSCATAPERRAEPASSGPARVRSEVVRRHAEQFRTELPERPAGSQEEELAATYVLGHLQRAGYVVFLDPVPVADLVQSTNVMALPPSGEDPAAVVVVPYDTSADAPDHAVSLGLFLELARATFAAAPDHSIEFVALGAQHADVSGGRLGARRLARYVADRDQHPVVLSLQALGEQGGVSAAGPAAPDLEALARRLGVATAPPHEDDPVAEVFTAAGFETTSVGGGADGAGQVLLHWLKTPPRVTPR